MCYTYFYWRIRGIRNYVAVHHIPRIHSCPAKSLQSCPTLCNPMDPMVARQAPLSMGFSRKEYWGTLPFPPPGDLPNRGIESASLMSPELDIQVGRQAGSLPLALYGKPTIHS